ncbi:MAG: hypothetical protein ACJAY2_000003 [Pseudomonadales bacterium]|jgi:hypothetical protein
MMRRALVTTRKQRVRRTGQIQPLRYPLVRFNRLHRSPVVTRIPLQQT